MPNGQQFGGVGLFGQRRTADPLDPRRALRGGLTAPFPAGPSGPRRSPFEGFLDPLVQYGTQLAGQAGALLTPQISPPPETLSEQMRQMQALRGEQPFPMPPAPTAVEAVTEAEKKGESANNRTILKPAMIAIMTAKGAASTDANPLIPHAQGMMSLDSCLTC